MGQYCPLAACITLALAIAWAPSARADQMDEIERKGRQLLEQLQRELDAARNERQKLEAERKQLEADRQKFEAEREAAPAATAGAAPAPADKTETDRKVDILASELEQLKTNVAVPPTYDYKSEYGLGPAASKVYSIARGLSIGGYGEITYSNPVSNTRGTDDRADALRFVLYTGYKFSDRIILNTEIEFEHGTTGSTVSSGSGEVAVEFAYLDFLKAFEHDWLNLRAGLVLVPLGFINEVHEPVYFFGVNRPEVERQLIPTTWREIGAGFFGNTGDFEYRGYALTSLNAEGFTSTGIRDGRQDGNRALANGGGGAARLDYTPSWAEGLLAGASVFAGNTTQDQSEFGNANGWLTLFDAHVQYEWRGLHFRGLAAFAFLDDAKSISDAVDETVANQMEGHYLEVAYDIMPIILPQYDRQYLAPFFRYEHLNTQWHVPAGLSADDTKDFNDYVLGLSYKPHPQVVLKFDYRGFHQEVGRRSNDINLGLGFVF
jgi:hypothetical protein